MTKKYKLIKVWIVFILAFSFIAEGTSISLKDYLCIALKNNSELESAYQQWQAALFSEQAADTLPDPKVGYGYYIQSVETRVGPQKNNLNISQTIPWIGKLKNRKNLAHTKALMAEQTLYVLTNALVKKVKDAFYDKYFIEKSIQINQENIALVNLLESVAQGRVQVGGQSVDAIQAQIEVNKLYDQVDALRKMNKSLDAKISALLNSFQYESIVLPFDLFDQKMEVLDHLVESDLKEKNPTLILLSLQTSKEKANYSLVKQDRYPDVTFGVNWIDTGKAITPTKDNGKDSVIATVSINLPIWWSTYRSRENAAKSQVVSAREVFVQKSQEIFASYRDVVLKYQDAQRRVLLYRDTLLPQAKQALEILIESYKTGKAEFDRVLESQRILLNFQLEYEKAIVDKAKAFDAYEEITGALCL